MARKKTNKAAKPLTLGALISGGGRTVENILDEIEAGRLDARVACCIASRECSGVQRLARRGLDVQIISYRQQSSIEEYSAAIARSLDAVGVELVVQAGFLSLWQIPQQYAGRVMNIHPALLPSFGGRGMYGHHVHEAVLARGCKVSGCTVHFVTNEYDAGPIIVQHAVPVEEGDDADSLAARVFTAECRAYPEAISLFAQARLKIDGSVVHIAAQ